MLCRRARSWISLSLDGALPPDRTVALSEHLERCGACRRHREELQFARRLLAATEPQLAENFEWRLQLKLNQTLREGARAATLPWEGRSASAGRWLRAAGLSAAAGLALVLAAGRLLPPAAIRAPAELPLVAEGSAGDSAEVQTSELTLALSPAGDVSGRVTPSEDAADSESGQRPVGDSATDPTRAPLDPLRRDGLLPLRGGNFFGRQVGTLEQGVFSGGRLGDVWSGRSVEDLRTIHRLRDENQRLRFALYTAQRDNLLLKAQLDSSRAGPQDQ